MKGDRLVVKLGHRFQNNSIILCRNNGDLMVKRARIQDGVIWLIPANPKMHLWACGENDQFEAIGVVIEVIRKPDTAAVKRVSMND